jgi:uncharacterized protein YaaQ
MMRGVGREGMAMQLVVAIVQAEDAAGLVAALTARRIGVTRIATAGGFLKAGNATLLSGVREEQLPDVLAAIRANCRSRTQLVPVLPAFPGPAAVHLPEPREVEIGGATVFLLEVEEVVHL